MHAYGYFLSSTKACVNQQQGISLAHSFSIAAIRDVLWNILYCPLTFCLMTKSTREKSQLTGISEQQKYRQSVQQQQRLQQQWK